jgi:hypothetical protein
MADSLTDLIQAIDQYMAKNAKSKTSGPYLATKVAAVFDDPNSLFNPDGILKTVTENVAQAFSDTITEMSVFDNMMELASDRVDSLRIAFEDTEKSLGGFNKYLAAFQKTLTLTHPAVPANVPPPVPAPVTAPYNHAQEMALRESKIVDVKIVGLSDSIIEKFNSWFENVKTTTDNKSTNIQNNVSSSNKEGKGIIGTIFGWISSIVKYSLLVVGGVFLLGKIKQFLNETDLGKTIKKTTLKILDGIYNFITNYINSGDLQKTLVDGVILIGDIVESIWGGIRRFWTDNEKAIKEAFGATKDGIYNNILKPFYDNILKPAWDGLKKKVDETDWSETLGSIGDWVWNNILAPIGNNIAKDFEKGDYSEGFAKILGIGVLGTLALSLTGLLKPLGLLGTVIRSVVGLAGPLKLLGTGIKVVVGLLGGGLVASLSALAVSAWAVKSNWDKLEKSVDEYTDSIHRDLTTSIKWNNTLKKQLSDIEIKQKQYSEKPIKSEKDSLENRLNLLEKTRIQLEKDKNTEIAKIDQTLNGLSFLEKIIFGNDYEKMKNSSLQDFNKKILDLEPQHREIMQRMKEIDSNTQPQPIKEIDPKQTLPKTITPLAVNDHKYSDLLGKIKVESVVPYAPVKKDVSSEQTNKKLDGVRDVIAEGMNVLIQTTAQGNNQVTQAIIASAGANQSTPASTMGGGSPIQNVRNYVKRQS